jgi:hypothetical protein
VARFKTVPNIAHLLPEELAETILDKERRIADIMNNQRPFGPDTMNELIFLIEDAPEGGFTARALGHSIFTEADSLEDLRRNVRDAVQCHFEEGKAPKVIRLHFVREEVLAS